MRLGLTGVLFFMLAGHASAQTTYCVNKLGGKCVHVDSLGQALQYADADDDHDRVEIGATTLSANGLSATKPVTVVGAGMGKTVIDSVDGLALKGAGSVLRDVSFRYAQSGTGLTDGIRVAGVVEQVDYEASGSDGNTGGIRLAGPDAVLRDSRVRLPLDDDDPWAVYVEDSATIENVDIVAPNGVLGRGRTIRSRMRVLAIGVCACGIEASVEDSLIHTGSDEELESEIGIYASAGGGDNGENHAPVQVRNVTVVGSGRPRSTGLLAASFDASPGPVVASIEVSGVVLAGYDVALARRVTNYTRDAAGEASIAIAHSAFDATRIEEDGHGSTSLGAGNVAGEPRFVDAVNADFRLHPASPLIDRGTPGAPAGLDLAGRPRIVDGDADGEARTDIGAFEYQGRATVSSLTATPATPAPGETVTFAATAVAGAEGEITGYRWDLDGDGGFETDTGMTPSATRAYGSPGPVTATLRVLGSDGAITERAVTVTVTAPPATTTAPAATANTLPLTIDRFRFSRRAFSVRLSAPATTVIRIARKAGRRYRRVATVRRHLPAGASTVRRRLKPGRYRATIVATDVAGRRATRRPITFRVTRR